MHQKNSRFGIALFITALLAAASAMATETTSASAAEDWKGQAGKAELDHGALTGVGIYRGVAGYTLLGTASKKLIHQGFAADINNSVSLETELGPLWVSSATAFSYSLHLRWDFMKDDQWGVYGLGGLAGTITGASLGDKFDLLPRFGVGGLYRVTDFVTARAELSHELIALGVAFPL